MQYTSNCDFTDNTRAVMSQINTKVLRPYLMYRLHNVPRRTILIAWLGNNSVENV
jgi:hypothetical protein